MTTTHKQAYVNLDTNLGLLFNLVLFVRADSIVDVFEIDPRAELSAERHGKGLAVIARIRNGERISVTAFKSTVSISTDIAVPSQIEAEWTEVAPE